MKTSLQDFLLLPSWRGGGRLALLLAAGLLLTGTTCKPTYGTRVTPSGQIVENSWLVADKIQVTGVKKESVNGFLRVQIDALNRSMHDYQFEYRFRWLNQNGIEEEQGWANFQTMFTTAKEPARFQGVAPNQRVTDFEFLVRFPDRVMEK